MGTDRKMKIIICIVLTISALSCIKRNTSDEIIINNQIRNTESQCDSIIYELPEKTVIAIEKLIAEKKVSLCYAGGNTNDGFGFSFPYDDKYFYTQRDSLLLQKTNIYLKVNEKYYPVITMLDEIFSNIPRTQGMINDFNSCFIEVDARGNLLKSFAY